MSVLDLRNAKRLFYGATEAKALYYGATKLWERPKPSIPDLSVTDYAFWDAEALDLANGATLPASWPATKTGGLGVGMAWDRVGTPTMGLDPNGRKWVNFDGGAYKKDGQTFPADMAISVWLMMRPDTNTTYILYNGPVESAQISSRIAFRRANMFFQAANGNHSYGDVINTGDGPLTYLWSKPPGGGTSNTVRAWQENSEKTFTTIQNRALTLDGPRFVWGSGPNAAGDIAGVPGMRSSAILVTFGAILSDADRAAMQAWAEQRRAAT